ncbi:cytochrome b5 reductase 4 isoform X1 [Cydia fagiglandana]|uniref:cytochrome b5 reductase 4 isoform X1 n=1 Tax=Cydia fagiglandana TaxID=1458189 RepID=UPI002FEE0564
MADSPPKDNTPPTRNGSLQISLPTVLCTPESSENSDILCKTKPFISSESKLSLPSNLGTPTSPLRLSSPLSLPTTPTPYMKITQPQPEKTVASQMNSPPTTIVQQTGPKQPLVNTGSATGNPRNKCALQPGHSLMDWIRLGNSGKDLTGVGGRMRPVSPDELAAHNTQNDAWLAIRGRVYNITHYLPYHPGGPEELMRGAGIDATQLFDKVHPWVNYDSLLAKCLVGPLRLDRPDAEELFGLSTPSPKSENRLREPSKAQELVRKSMENLANCITPVRKKMSAKSEENLKGSPPSKIMQSLIQSSDLPVSISRRAAASPVKTSEKSDTAPSPLRFDWIQTSTKLTLSIYTGPLANPGGCARIIEGILFVEVATNGWVRTLKLVPEAKLLESLQLRVFAESGKIEVISHKAEPGVWKTCGEAVTGAACRVSTPRSVSCRVARVSRVSHDTVLLSLAAPAQALVAPLGHHVRVHRTISDVECVRSYTPVGEGWGPDADRDSAIHLAVKGYETGALSPYLTALQPGDEVTVSGPYGNFQLHTLKGVKEIYFVAAGTGITPMLGLLKFMLPRPNPRCERIHLLFFNKTEEDILFRNNFEEIAREDDRFSVTHVLSDAGPSWPGQKGRVTTNLLTQVIGKDSLKCRDQCTHFACVCGPTEFTHTAIDLLKKLDMKDSCIHAFMG